LTPPLTNVSRGEPQAKLLGAFSLVRFFGASKEMNEKKYYKIFCTPKKGCTRLGCAPMGLKTLKPRAKKLQNNPIACHLDQRERYWRATLCRGRMCLSNGRAEARPSKSLLVHNG